MKTAGRIVGSAAFLSGFQVQDSPVYGAERRGAAVAAFTRIDREPIRERGIIDAPDLIIVGDETLLSDPGAAVLAGQRSAAAVFVNAPTVEGLAQRSAIEAPLQTCDLTARTLAALGMASALSAGLAAAAVRLTGLIPRDALGTAVRQELEFLHARPELIEKNIEVALGVFDELTPVSFRDRALRPAGELHVVELASPALGTASIVAGGNAVLRQTGTWRVERPEIDREVCTRCGLCVVACPDGAMSLDAQGFPVIDYDHCKGCMICSHLCPLHGIGRTREVRAW